MIALYTLTITKRNQVYLFFVIIAVYKIFFIILELISDNQLSSLFLKYKEGASESETVQGHPSLYVIFCYFLFSLALPCTLPAVLSCVVSCLILGNR